MGVRNDELLQQASKLPREQREELAAALVASCEAEAEKEASFDGAWKAEVERRTREGLPSGWAGSRDWTVVRAELLGRRKAK
jgi:hypothetical protein